MTSAIDNRDEFDFENPLYRPEITRGMNVHNPDHHSKEPKGSDLSARIKFVKDIDKNTMFEIDTAIRAVVPSKRICQDKASHWQPKLIEAKRFTLIGGIAGVLALAATATAAAFSFNYVVKALGVATLGVLSITFYQYSKAREASRQIDGWQAPSKDYTQAAARLANERSLAYEKGFIYAMENDLKLFDDKLGRGVPSSNTAVLVPSEVQLLYTRYIDSFCNMHLNSDPKTDREKKAWLSTFTTNNPFSKSVLDYAHKGSAREIPERLLLISNDFDVLNAQLTDLRSEFKKLREQRSNETQSIIEEIKSNRKQDLAQFIVMHQSAIAHAKAKRDHDLSINKLTPEQINNEYNKIEAQYNRFLELASRGVNSYYGNQLSSAKETLDLIIAQISKNENSSHACFYDYARDLLVLAKKINQDSSFVYTPQDYKPEHIFKITAPSAFPRAAIDFVEQARKEIPQELDQDEIAEYRKFLDYNTQQRRIA